jgi:hypothetical protein
LSSIFSVPRNSSVLGWWPIARNRPSAGTWRFLPGLRVGQLDAGDLARLDVEHVADRGVPQHLDLRVLQRAVLHDLRGAQRVAAHARKTLLAYLVRKFASSHAESPPPTT